jgi:TonB family protein
MIFRRRVLFQVSLLLGLSLVSVCANAQVKATPLRTRPDFTRKLAEWDRYTIRGGEFSVLLPGAPAMSWYPANDDRRQKVNLRNLVGVYSQGVVYSVYVFDRKTSLEDFVQMSPEVKVGDYVRDLQLGKFAGKEYVSKTEHTKLVGQYFITDRFIYLFLAAGSYLVDPEPGITRFFESIRFTSSDDDIAIVEGEGFQPTVESATAERVFPGKEVDRKAVVIAKPEPRYTEAARKNQIAGTVVIRGVFSKSGIVTDVQVLSSLEDGLTEKALSAARQIRYIPAIKDGHFVSMYIQVEYNFNLY